MQMLCDTQHFNFFSHILMFFYLVIFNCQFQVNSTHWVFQGKWKLTCQTKASQSSLSYSFMSVYTLRLC